MADALTPKQLGTEWNKGTFRPAYGLYGEDAPAKQLALETLRKKIGADDFNLNEFSGDDESQAGEIVSACQTPPMFSDRRLVIVRSAKFKAPARKIIADYLRDPLKSTTLLLICPEAKVDKKDAMAAGLKALGGLVLFKAMKENEAVRRLVDEAGRMGFTLAPDAADALVEEAGTEWGILRAELEKVKLFIGEGGQAGTKEVAACLGYSQKANPFELSRLVQKRDARAALNLLRRQLREASNSSERFRLLAQISNAVNKQLRAKRMLKSGDTPEKILPKLRVFYDRDFIPIVNRISENSLIRSLSACLETEKSLKSRSWLDPEIELENLVLKVCGK
jgi:DNA polymerase-3 subunit delta